MKFTATIKAGVPVLIGAMMALNAAESAAQEVCVDFDNFTAGTSGSSIVVPDMTLSTNSNSRPLMIFDTENPTGGDADLGAPHQDFGGPGIGNGGKSGAAGENANVLGEVLIISTNGNSSNPNDHAGGGDLIFTFDQPVTATGVEVLDVDNGDDYEVHFYDNSGNLIQTNVYTGLGNNAFHSETFSIANVKEMVVELEGSGAVAKVCYEPLDSDGDGVADDLEDFPNDPTRSFTSNWPCCGSATLAFEDLWPNEGDYDFNDLVIDYQFETVTNSNNFLVEVIATFEVIAFGAGYHNGFGFQLPNSNINPADITVTGYNVGNLVNLGANGLENGQSKPTIIVYEDSYDIMAHPGSGIGVNTTPGAPSVPTETITITMTFSEGTFTANDLDIANFNPFIFANETRGREIHLPNYAPTDLADNSYFGTGDDDSNAGTGRYYKTANNLPWAINVQTGFDHMQEKVEITLGYNFFFNWAASSGATNSTWNLPLPGNRNNSNLY